MEAQPETDAATKLVTILIRLVVHLIRVKPVALAELTLVLTVVAELEPVVILALRDHLLVALLLAVLHHPLAEEDVIVVP